MNINSVGTAINVNWDINKDSKTADLSDDPYPFFLMNNGTLNIRTEGELLKSSSQSVNYINADGKQFIGTAKLTPEGVSAEQAVFIKGGVIFVESSDDSLSAGRSDNFYAAHLLIENGKLYIYSKGDDALDSNGTMLISGGVLVAISDENEAMEVSAGYTNITGGIVLGVYKYSTSKPKLMERQNQKILSLNNNMIKNNLIIRSFSNEVVYIFDNPKIVNKDNYYFISSPKLLNDEEYSLYTNGTISGGESFYNLYIEMPFVTNDKKIIDELNFVK